ncbi:MAG: hypothetical protein FJZ96_15930, partial [Chloroflexi bacterium]|nr:hypothetical protein [Chloroflexota bacterium]
MNNIPIQQARTIEVQTPISAEESRWQDLRRARNIYLPILLTAFIAILAAIGYITIHPERFVKLGTAPTAGLWPVAGLMSTILGPILVITIGIVFLMKTGSSFIRAFYRPPEDMKLQPLIRRRLVGVPPAPVPLSAWMKYPFVTIREPVLREDHWVRWLGGPATLVIYDGAALYLERGNKFSRVVGPGTPPMPFLERYETVKAVIDLRPQVDTRQMHPWTKDGIQLDLEVKLECQIDASEEARNASLNLVYPYDPLAVKKAVEYTAVRYDSDRRQLVESNWVDGVWGQVTGFILGHFSRHSIDEISLAELEDIGPSEGH